MYIVVFLKHHEIFIMDFIVVIGFGDRWSSNIIVALPSEMVLMEVA